MDNIKVYISKSVGKHFDDGLSSMYNEVNSHAVEPAREKIYNPMYNNLEEVDMSINENILNEFNG